MSTPSFWDGLSPEWLRGTFDELVPSNQVDMDVVSDATPDEKYCYLISKVNERMAEIPVPNSLVKAENYWSPNFRGAALHFLACLEDLRHNYPAAEKGWFESLAYNDPCRPNLSSLSNIAYSLKEQGKFMEAETNYRSLVPLIQGKIGVRSPQALGALRSMIECIIQQGRVSEAVLLLEVGNSLVQGMDETTQEEKDLKADEAEAMNDVESMLARLHSRT